MIEKRGSKRFKLKVAAESRLMMPNFKTMITGVVKVKSVDVSTGGMRLRWPAGWKCKKCENCAGWVFNRDCKLKRQMAEPLNRSLNTGIRINLKFLKKTLQEREYYAKIVWVDEAGSKKAAYDAGVSFAGADREFVSRLRLL